MDALLWSTLTVAIAEIGDKTQLLALLLAARYRKPWPIVAGIFAATLLNHAVSAWAGDWLAGLVSPQALRWERPVEPDPGAWTTMQPPELAGHDE